MLASFMENRKGRKQLLSPWRDAAENQHAKDKNSNISLIPVVDLEQA
jgi:hypothetical protein